MPASPRNRTTRWSPDRHPPRRSVRHVGAESAAGRSTAERRRRTGGRRSPPPPPVKDKLEQLKELGELKAQGVLTEQEFATEKAKVLAG